MVRSQGVPQGLDTVFRKEGLDLHSFRQNLHNCFKFLQISSQKQNISGLSWGLAAIIHRFAQDFAVADVKGC